MQELKMVYWPIDKLIKYERNTKTHPQTQIDAIASSIKKFGFDQPIAIDTQGIIIKGHGRLMAAKHLGMESVPVIIRDDLSLIEAAASRISDNRVAESPWDEELLPIELNMLDENGIDIFDIGFDEDEIKGILKSFEPGQESEQGKLDKKKLTICPNCNYEF